MAAAAFSYRLNQSSSDSDSDDSSKEILDWKRASRNTIEETKDLEKIPIGQPQINPSTNNNNLKRKRNNIWSDVIHGQLISESLNHCGIKNKPAGYGSRGEESYDYTLSDKYRKEHSDDSDDQMSDDEDSLETNAVPFKKRTASESVSFHSKNHPKHYKSNKFVELDPAGKAAARKIIKVLNEQKQYLIYRVVKFIGIEKAMQLLRETEAIEENGGMKIKNLARRRTPGGVYFQLLKADKDIEKASIDKIFEGEMTSYDRKKFFEEKRKQKKLRKEKAKLLEECKLLMDICESGNQTEEAKMDEDSMAVEQVEEMVENKTNNKCFSSVVEEATRTSDLEDGEIED
ncbi:phosphorylated adapter RNA export protein [Caerostris darwini]|uniref:Phosphorylated adapter RNA export protein n=1 Tax=Caerostris darwini TaxID=1538125 RepID=A0AAV4WU22_9ARAC|nr:phosphorylated adapter RNA export protein [Caerostris darwini]